MPECERTARRESVHRLTHLPSNELPITPVPWIVIVLPSISPLTPPKAVVMIIVLPSTEYCATSVTSDFIERLPFFSNSVSHPGCVSLTYFPATFPDAQHNTINTKAAAE